MPINLPLQIYNARKALHLIDQGTCAAWSLLCMAGRSVGLSCTALPPCTAEFDVASVATFTLVNSCCLYALKLEMYYAQYVCLLTAHTPIALLPNQRCSGSRPAKGQNSQCTSNKQRRCCVCCKSALLFTAGLCLPQALTGLSSTLLQLGSGGRWRSCTAVMTWPQGGPTSSRWLRTFFCTLSMSFRSAPLLCWAVNPTCLPQRGGGKEGSGPPF